jgi:hypothetical protein
MAGDCFSEFFAYQAIGWAARCHRHETKNEAGPKSDLINRETNLSQK